jgi:hypothetical protein
VSVKYGYRPVGIRAEEVGLLLHMWLQPWTRMSFLREHELTEKWAKVQV